MSATTDLATLRRLTDVVEEYDAKFAAAEDTVGTFEKAGNQLKELSTVAGAWGNVSIDTGRVSERDIRMSLLRSAWRHVYDGLKIDRIASARDKDQFQMALENPAPFTLDNIRGTFGKYLEDPRGNILRGLAEAFCDLDPAYRSHSKVKVGVAGLPKRIILSSVGNYGGWGTKRLENVLNALAAYQGKPLVEWLDISELLKDGDIMREGGVVNRRHCEPYTIIPRGVWLKRFANGNGHLFFDADTLKDINRALAEFYGDILPDVEDDAPSKPRASTAVSKDLQYYPTPDEIAARIVDGIYIRSDDKVLEPSCGCGRLIKAIKAKTPNVVGIEFDPKRVEEARSKGFSVVHRNFLEVSPPDDLFNHVVMNPPFYGKHYAKHIQHALKFLKPDGVLTAILPSTARYDHGLVDGSWTDLPVGSFSASGTNVNTSVLTIKIREIRKAA